MSVDKKLIYSFIEYLNSLKTKNSNTDNIDTIVGLLEGEFDITSDSAESFESLSLYPTSLADIFRAGVQSTNSKSYSEKYSAAKLNSKFDVFVDAVTKKGYFEGTEEGKIEYLQRYAKLITKFQEKTAASPESSSTVDKTESEKQAEELKVQGNAAINSKKYLEAAVFYTKALKLSPDGPNSHVYYSNRAAAYCHLNKYQVILLSNLMMI